MTQFLPYLLILVCPLTMGLMMWMMMRMGSSEKSANQARIAELEAQLRDLPAVNQKEPETAERRA